MKKNIFYILAITILFISCEKNVESPAPPIPAPPIGSANFSKEALAYVQIPLNKYFIYKDSISGNTDSVFVTQSALETKLIPDWTDNGFFKVPAHYSQTFTLSLSKVNGNITILWFNGIAGIDILQGNTESAGLNLVERDGYANYDGYSVFYYPFGKHNIIPNITIEGKDYSDVLQFTYGINGLPSNSRYFATTFYWAKGIGIIKRIVTTATLTQTWTLLRHG